MATRTKTVEYSMPTLASIVDNTLTSFTQITIYLPESSKTFRSVRAQFTADDIVTATGGTWTSHAAGWRLAAVAYTTVTNTNDLVHSGENLSAFFEYDMTSMFTTNWSGTSMTFDFRVQMDQSTGTTLGLVNGCVTIFITYEYDDTSATQIKTVWIPLNANEGTIASAATTEDTFPDLDALLPEASKTYRRIFVVVQGNTQVNASTTDNTLTISVGATTVTTGNYEAALATDRMFRYVFDLTAAGFTDVTNSQNFQLHSSVATRFHHLQAWAVVTYEFSPGSTTQVMNSLLVPLSQAPMGGTSSTLYQRLRTPELMIEEPGTITTTHLAAMIFFTEPNELAGWNMRLGTGSFVAYTDVPTVIGGGNAAMIRNDSAFTLARGSNTLSVDVYHSAEHQEGWCGYVIVNYTSDVATAGVGAHNHTCKFGIMVPGTGASDQMFLSGSTAPAIPESAYFVSALGVDLEWMVSNTTTAGSYVVDVASGNGGYELVVPNSGTADPEVGWSAVHARTPKDLFQQYPTDPTPGALALETNRVWRVSSGFGFGWANLDLWVTYHAITYTIAGTVSDYADADGAGLTVRIFRGSDNRCIGTATTTAGGAYTFTWYDNIDQVFAVCLEDATHVGASILDEAA